MQPGELGFGLLAVGRAFLLLIASPSCMIAICGAFFATSSIQGNCSRFTAFNWRRNAACDGSAEWNRPCVR
ncbi:hypothetical protein [Cupriavidus sp. D39]|uniref:hypothetical protein n=1 Tax=Cupriavidus sp. D39 TaxID=2997877 RepID=UPI002270E11B|nr:hypothetical protein [Cupriavidus sp. D39]MCY0858744.1 hypothetical protein [Cupriavidus sp. D39]